MVLLFIEVNRRGGSEKGLLGLLVATTALAVAARIGSLLARFRAAAAVGLRALRCGPTAAALRVTSVFGIVASALVGLGTIGLGLVFLGGGIGRILETVASYLLVVGVPGVWLVGLAGGIVCTIAARKVSNRLRRLKAAAV